MRFNCPHGLRFGPDGNLYIADRGNRRIAVYDNDGKFIKANNEVTHSPCMFDFHNGLILVPELMTGVKVLDMKLNVVAELGANPAVVDEPRPEGWPNLAGTEHVQPGKFNSPHGGCFGPDDSIYVAEWIVGGRITKLEKN
jgi:DNA-binding beta-propeller fold protein YncE